MSNTLSSYFSKKKSPSPSPERNTGVKRKRFLFNAGTEEQDSSVSPPRKVAKTVKSAQIKQKDEKSKNNDLSNSPSPKRSSQSKSQVSSTDKVPLKTVSDPFARLSQFSHSSTSTPSNSPFKKTLSPKKDLVTKKKGESKLITKVANIKKPESYTPLEKQVLELWKKHPGVILAIEVGYRFVFMGDDAIKASKVLNFVLTPPKGKTKFSQCMVPAVTLHVHLHRLVNAGLKVGVVAQTETRELKKVSGNKNAPFTRELTQLYTKGTFISPVIDPITDSDTQKTRKSGSADSGFLLSFCELERESIDNRVKVEIGLVAVNVCTGEIIWDCFIDTFLRPELENRLASIRPTEVFFPKSEFLSKQSENLIQQYFYSHCKEDNNNNNTIVSKDKDNNNIDEFNPNSVRIERCNFNEDDMKKVLSSFYMVDDPISEFPLTVKRCVGQLIKYLSDFSLQNLLQLTQNFKPFSEENIVPLDRSAIEQLEILENIDGTSKKNNLFWLIDLTLTSFGSRLLKYWLLHPMKFPDKINERLDAVEELTKTGFETVKQTLNGLPDLERGICRLFYHKCEPIEYIAIMRSFMSIFKHLKNLKEEKFSSALLNKTIQSIPDISSDVSSWLSCLSIEAARIGKKENLFQVEHLSIDPYPEVTKQKIEISKAEEKLNDILAQIRRDTGFPRLKYINVAADEYLIELTIKQSQTVPPDWLFINKTKSARRYHTPAIKQQYSILCQHRELLEIALNNAWKQFVEKSKEKYYELRSVVVNLAILDCILALAIKGRESNYTRPLIKENDDDDDKMNDENSIKPPEIIIEQGRHPIVEAICPNNEFVPNDTNLKDDLKCIMLTGPNMGGKSCYIKQVALIVLLSQIGSFVPASFAKIDPVDRIMVRMGAHDSMEQGKSTFFIEMQETSEILHRATNRSLVILDELGRGTSTHDGVAIADATLRYLLTHTNCFLLFVTHYHLLCQTASQFPTKASSFHMGFHHDDEEESEYSITFLYQLINGMASKSYGLNVAQLAGIPGCIIKRAKEKSENLADSMQLIDSSGSKATKDAILQIMEEYRENKRSKQETQLLLLKIWDVLKNSVQPK